MKVLAAIVTIGLGTMATVLFGFYSAESTYIDASAVSYGLPLPWLVYAEGSGVAIVGAWQFQPVLFALDALFFSFLAYVAIVLARRLRGRALKTPRESA